MSALAALLLTAAAAAQPPRLALSLDDAERDALAHSPLLKAADGDLAAAEALVDAALAPLAPRLTLDGGYQYQTEAPKVALSPGAPTLQFGDHDAYSVGPTASVTLWDRGALRKAWRGQQAAAASRRARRDLIRRQVRLMTRLDYFDVQLALERERSLLDSLRLVEAQYADIGRRLRAGAASRVDWLSAHQQVLDRRRDLRSAQADVSSSLRALFALTGRGQDEDLAAPLDARVEAPPPDGVAPASVLVALEPLNSVEGRLAAAASAALDGSHPQLLVYARQAEAQRWAADSASAGLWPRLRLTLKSDYLYPDTPLLKSAWQTTAAVAASVPLFERGQTRSQARAQRALADADERRRDAARDDLERDWRRARDELASLRDQEALDRESVDETAEIARLRYASYRDGGATILDVEAANVGAVQARIQAARTRARALIQLATLDSLTPSSEAP